MAFRHPEPASSEKCAACAAEFNPHISSTEPRPDHYQPTIEDHMTNTDAEAFKLTPVCLADIQAEEPTFWWNPYIPAGTLTLMFGYGGIGKSWISCALAADASVGRSFPGHTTTLPPQKVLMATAEDDAAYVLKPRLASLGADMRNIYVLEQPFTLDRRGIGALKKAMENMEAAIVFLDPLVSYLGGQMDINKSNEARAMIGPLALAARDTGCAVVVIHHERKGGTGRAPNKAMGSADFINGVRSALHVSETKEGQKFMKHVKSNWSKAGPTLEFAIDNDTFRWGGSQPNDLGKPLGAADLPVVRARALLKEMLMPGPQSASAVMHRAFELGITDRTLTRAKIGIVQAENKGGIWFWSLQNSTWRPKHQSTTQTPEELLAQVGRGASPDLPSEV